MGMSRLAIYVTGYSESDAVGLASRLGFVDTPPIFLRVAADQSDVRETEVGIGVYGTCAVIFADSGPFLENDYFNKAANFSNAGCVFCWLTQSASGGLWFEKYSRGVSIRKWVQVDGEVEVNEGLTLPEEVPGTFTQDPDGGDEWEIVDLAGRITGITSDVLFAMPFAVYRQKV